MAFIGAITPGPDILLVLQTTLRCGFKQAMLTLLGIATGWVLYLGLLYFGLATFFKNPMIQMIFNLFGGLYLSYLGYLLLKKSKNNLKLEESSVNSGYFKGLIINLTNPKAVLFFAIIVAPYMDKNLLFNLSILFLGLFSAFMCVILVALFLQKFITNRLFDIIDKICGVIFFAFAITLFVLVGNYFVKG